jgi:hypothetical protein
MQCQPLDKGLNMAILAIAARLFPTGFDVSADAPDTYHKLKSHLDAGNRMVVYGGGSEGTIYGDPEVNHAFRAWHDLCHWSGEYDFSVQGEAAVCKMQAFQLRQMFGSTPQTKRWAEIIRAEVIGQRLFYGLNKRYVTDQTSFVQAYMLDPTDALVKKDW